MDGRSIEQDIAAAAASVGGNGEYETSPEQPPPDDRPPDADGTPAVVLGTDEYRCVIQTINAMAADPTIYHRGGCLVRVDRNGDGARIGLLPRASLRERITKHTRIVVNKLVKKEWEQVPAHPPNWLVEAIEARGDWPGLRPINSISDSPILRPDGTVCQDPGYDAASGVLYEPTAEFPAIPPDVGPDDADWALAQLLEVVEDFSFEGPEHRAAWLAGLLTPFARFAFAGPSPLFLIDANIRGAGKGLLAQAIGHVVLGREMPPSSYTDDAEEMRKQITSLAIGGDRMFHMDNVTGDFGNAAMDRALTSGRWKDRILGGNREVDLPLLATWYATGNNVAIAADTARRIIHCRLDVLSEKPEERTGFAHPELTAWILSERPRLVVACLTILRAYFAAGRPRASGILPYGSFEGWSRLVREAIIWLGQPDPCLTRLGLAERSDTTGDALGQLLQAWREYSPTGGVYISEMMARLYAAQFRPTDEASTAMRNALETLTSAPLGRVPTAKSVGRKLSAIRRTVRDGLLIDYDPDANDKRGKAWRLYSVESKSSVSANPVQQSQTQIEFK